MKILIGVDESPHATAAVEFVKRMKWPADTRVVVVSAVAPPVVVYAEAYVPLPDYYEELNQQLLEAHQKTAGTAERVLRDGGFQAEARVIHGDPRDALVELAQNEGADLLVVGSHGRSGVAKLLMGSVASHVVTHAPCSVLVVKMPKTSRGSAR